MPIVSDIWEFMMGSGPIRLRNNIYGQTYDIQTHILTFKVHVTEN